MDDGIKLAGGHAGVGFLHGALEAAEGDAAGGAHEFEFAAGFELDDVFAFGHEFHL